MALVFAALGLVFAWVWSGVNLQSAGQGFTLQEFFGMPLAIIGVGVGGRFLARKKPLVKFLALVVTLLGCIVIVALAQNGTFLAAKWHGGIATTHLHSDEAVWLAEANAAIGDIKGINGGCQLMSASVPALGTANICASPAEPKYQIYAPQVLFERHAEGNGYGGYYGLTYAPGRLSAPDECVSHLTGPWWQFMDPQLACPPGWRFIPAP